MSLKHIARLGIDDSHFTARITGRTGPRRSWTDDELRRAVAASTTLSDVQRRLGFEPSGGMYRFLNSHIKRLAISTEHFLGQSWARGQRRSSGRRAIPLDEILVRDSDYSGSLRKRLIGAGLKLPICEHCGLDTWRGETLPLALDHVNGDPRDNRLENLRILCPNCHSLTDTWCGRKNGQAYSNKQRDIAENGVSSSRKGVAWGKGAGLER